MFRGILRDEATTTGALAQTEDPLRLWNDGREKEFVPNFVAAVTRDSLDFVLVPQCIATFNNDATLRVEHPRERAVGTTLSCCL
jgi:hypothetical protein